LDVNYNVNEVEQVEFFNKFYHGDGVAFTPIVVNFSDLSTELHLLTA
jgi:hypothetical protein